MIVADIGGYQALKGFVINLIQQTLRNNLITYQDKLKELYSLYGEEDINRAIQYGIRRAGNKVYVQTYGLDGRILRSLEYGTGRTKAYHLITKSVRKVIGGRVI